MSTEITCSGCDSCQICDGCMVDCEDCQSFCETGGQNSNNGFSFDKCISSGEAMTPDSTGFSRNDWNNAINRINSVFREGSQSNASSSTISTNTSDLYLSAAEFKRVASAAGYTSDNSNIVSGALIYGTYFSRLENAIANLKYKWGQCDMCNAACDGGCNECMSCDSGCEGETTYCCHCDDTPTEGS